jgi:hypothetical protein
MKIWEFKKKSKKYFVFEKKCIYFFFEVFVFLHIFQKVKKWKFLCFFLKSKIRNVLELQFWHKTLTNFNENCFGASLRLFQRLKKNFYFFEIHVHALDQSEKNKSWKFENNFQKCQTFWNFICVSAAEISAENSIKNILLPQISTKRFLSQIRPLHHLKIRKVVHIPQKWGHFWVGGGYGNYMWLIPMMF